MARKDAFTAGVKPGGLTDGHQIRLLLCYLITNAGPVTKDEIVTALLAEQLVNYFEISSGLEELCARELAACSDGSYTITEKGRSVAATLESELPRSVRESAVQAAVRAQAWNKKSASYSAQIQETDAGYSIRCTIRGMTEEDFCLQLMMPDRMTAELVKKRFILRGNEIYDLLMHALTDPPQKQD